MRKAFFTLVFILSGLSLTMAQTEKGRWMVGASVGSLSYSSQNGYRSFSTSVSPSAGYFVATNLVVGTGIPFSLSTSKYYNPSGDAHARNVSIGLSPYVRYYIGERKLKPYVGLAYAYSQTDQQTESGGQTNKANGSASSVTPTLGIVYFINRTVALSAGLSYVWDRYKSAYVAYDANGNRVDAPVATSTYLSLGIGFQIFLGK